MVLRLICLQHVRAEASSLFAANWHLAQLARFLCTDDAFSHQEVDRARHTEVLHEQVLAAFVRQQPEAQRGTADTRAPGRDAEVAGQRERESGLDRDAVEKLVGLMAAM